MRWREDPSDISIIRDNMHYPRQVAEPPYRYSETRASSRMSRGEKAAAWVVGLCFAGGIGLGLAEEIRPAFEHSFADYVHEHDGGEEVPAIGGAHP